MADAQTVSGILDRFSGASQGDRTSVAQILHALGETSFAANLLIASAAVVSPLSGVPFFSSICGITIALISAQMLAGRKHLWLPKFLMRKQVQTQRLRSASAFVRRPAEWMDQIGRQRLAILLRQPSLFFSQLLCLICGILMPFLEILPFTSSILGAVVCFFAFGMLGKDGLFTLLGYLSVIVLPLSVLLILR